MAEGSVARLMLAAARRGEQAFRALAALAAMNVAVMAWAENLLSEPAPPDARK